MNPLALIISIAQTLAQALLVNKGNPSKVAEYTGYLNLASVLAARFTEGNTDLIVLNDQLKEAVAENRGLTDDQRAVWRARDDLATDIAREWLETHS